MSTIEVSDINPASALSQVDDATIAQWSDEKKKEFVTTFQARTRAARYILEKTAQIVIQEALTHHYISEKHVSNVWKLQNVNADLFDASTSSQIHFGHTSVGGRNTEQLDEIARERAEAILKELPPLQQAVQIISPETAEMIVRRDEIVKEGNKLTDRLEEISEPISMADIDQKMTVGEFRQMVKNIKKERMQLISQLNELGEEGSELENKINKNLFKGLPGLSDAILNVATSHAEKSLALDEMGRRVGEKVQFGDSAAALELLHHFEEDEVKVNDSIKAEFKSAMEKLQLSSKSTRRLSKGKGK